VAEPLLPELITAIENGEIGDRDDPKVRARKLADDFAWDVTEARKIWAFGPESTGPNILVDGTKGVQYMNEVKDSVVAAFEWITKKGVLAEEQLSGVKFMLTDALLHSDRVHRGGGQVIPSAHRVFSACQLTSEPRLLEPVYLVDIQCPQTVVSAVHNAVNQRRGLIVDSIPHLGTPLYNLKAHLPVSESFGFNEYIRSKTSGQAFIQCVFDHWELMSEDPLKEGTTTNDLVLKIRKRKGIELVVPPLARFLDKL
jgi:elongation factor 2